MATVLAGSERRVGSGSLRKTSDGLVYESQMEFTVVASSKYDDRGTILTATGLPTIGDSQDGPAICQSLDAERSEVNPAYWIVKATFSSAVNQSTHGAPALGNGGTIPHPTEFVPIISIGMTYREEVLERDLDDNAIENSAGTPFSTGLTVNRAIPTFEFEQFESDSLTLDAIVARHETINTSSFGGFAAKTLLLKVKAAEIGFYYGYRVWRVSYSIEYDKNTWTQELADIGPYYYDAVDDLFYTFEDVFGNPIIGKLNGTSGYLDPQTDQTVFRSFEIYPDIDFSTFIRT